MHYHCFVLFSGSLFSIVVSEPTYSYSKDYYNEDSKDAFYDDFGELDGNASRTYEVALPSVTNCTFTFMKGVLNITFMPNDVEHHCIVHLLGQLYPMRNIHPVKAVESVIFKRNEFVESSSYNISIKCEDFMDSRCTSEEVYLDGYKTDVRDCTDWNVAIGLSADHRMHHMTASIIPKKGYELCFENYTVELHRFNVKCQMDSSLNKTEEVLYKNEAMNVKFTGIFPGKYCAKVTAKHKNCFNNICGVRLYQESEELQEVKYNDPLELQQEKTSLLVIILPIGIMCTVFLVGFVATKMLKTSLIYQVPADKSSYVKEPPGNGVQSEEKIVVTILNAQCVEPQQEVDLAIYDFLKDCCNVHPVIAESDPELLINSSAWIQKNFNYKHLSSDTIKHKILVLETDASVMLYNHWKSFGHTLPMK